MKRSSKRAHGGKKTLALWLALCLFLSSIVMPAQVSASDSEEPVGQLKILARYNDSMQFYDGHVYLLFTSYQDGVTITVPDLYAGYEISDQYYTDIRENIANGSNHSNPAGSDPEEEAARYFTLNPDMTSVTLNRGEIVTIGMYRDFDLSVLQAMLGSILNSTIVQNGDKFADIAKTAFMENLFHYLKYGTPTLDNALTRLIAELTAEGIDPAQFLNGVVGGGVCFNRELYNQKLEWDQYENVTYELDITEAQLRRMEKALEGNFNNFSLLKNSCATVALRAWNAAVGTEDGVPNEWYLEPSGEGIFAFIDAPKTVKEEIIRKLPGYYLNNSEGVAEPNAGYQDETGWVYVSAPEVLPTRFALTRSAGLGTEERSRSASTEGSDPGYVGRLTIAARHFLDGNFIAHSMIVLTTYEDLELDASWYRYYKPTEKYIALMEDYEDHPENYGSDPALYSDALDVGDRNSYFAISEKGALSEPETIRLRAGEGITVSSYAHEPNYLLLMIHTLENGQIASSPYAQALIAQMRLYDEGGQIDGPLAFDAMAATVMQIYQVTRTTGSNPADGIGEGGIDINREARNQFCSEDAQSVYQYYTAEITAAELEAFRAFLADPGNNSYSLFTNNCTTFVVALWNATFFDRPELTPSGNLTGFGAEPESLCLDLLRLFALTGKCFDGSGEGYGTSYYPRIAPGYERQEPDEPCGRDDETYLRAMLLDLASYGWMKREERIEKKSDVAEANALPFADVSESDPFYKDVKFVYENQLMNGLTAEKFGPDSPLERGMLVAILYRLDGEPAVTGNPLFEDVDPAMYYAQAIEWAAKHGIVNGFGDGAFGPEKNVTREQLAAILYRYALYRGCVIRIDDVETASSAWAETAVKWAVSNGILAAEGTVTECAARAEVAAAVRAFLRTAASGPAVRSR